MRHHQPDPKASGLTGNTRHRAQRFTGKLILQVEVRYRYIEPNPYALNAYREGTSWRDASPEDITVTTP
jgi:hypothetical protein